MSLKVSLTALVSLLALSGCVVYGDGYTKRSLPLDVTLNLTFEGTSNCFSAGVDTVRVRFAGDALQTVTVPCDSRGGIAVNYQSVYRGSYTASIDALDNGSIVYSGDFTFTVDDGFTNFLFDLQDGASELVTNFTFAAASNRNTGGMTCAEAGVNSVRLTVDNGTPFTVPCHDSGSGRDAASISGLSAGRHSIVFEVFNEKGETLYASQYDKLATSGGYDEYDINVLGVAKGGLQIQWDFSNALSCSAAGVTLIDYELVGPNGPVKNGTISCAVSNGGFNYLTLSPETANPLTAGMYSLTYLRGRDNGGYEIYNSGGAVTGLYVAAGDLRAFKVTLGPR
jgi:hypothetical protein